MYLFDRAMKQQVTQSDYNDIITAFNEYHNFRIRYSSADIYKELRISKNAPQDEIYKGILRHMNDYIGETKSFKNLTSNSAWQNMMFIIDRYTCAFHYVYEMRDSINAALETVKKLETQSLAVEARDIGTMNFCEMGVILNYLKNCLEEAMKLMNEYVNESRKAPQAIVHYDVVVTDVANRWLCESVPDPITAGTRYEKLIKAINKSIGDTARTIAKNAAKWGLD